MASIVASSDLAAAALGACATTPPLRRESSKAGWRRSGRKAAHVGLELRASPAAVRAGRTDGRGRGGGTSAVQETARRSVVVTEPRGALRVCSSVALRRTMRRLHYTAAHLAHQRT